MISMKRIDYLRCSKSQPLPFLKLRNKLTFRRQPFQENPILGIILLEDPRPSL